MIKFITYEYFSGYDVVVTGLWEVNRRSSTVFSSHDSDVKADVAGA